MPQPFTAPLVATNALFLLPVWGAWRRGRYRHSLTFLLALLASVRYHRASEQCGYHPMCCLAFWRLDKTCKPCSQADGPAPLS